MSEVFSDERPTNLHCYLLNDRMRSVDMEATDSMLLGTALHMAMSERMFCVFCGSPVSEPYFLCCGKSMHCEPEPDDAPEEGAGAKA